MQPMYIVDEDHIIGGNIYFNLKLRQWVIDQKINGSWKHPVDRNYVRKNNRNDGIHVRQTVLREFLSLEEKE